jgi:hypothetical protein
MASEEIQVKFGGDLGPLAQSLRGLKGMVADAKKEFSISDVMSKFRGGVIGGLASIGIGFSVEKLRESAKASMELGKHISVLSNELGVSTDFFQQWGISAEHSGSNAEKAQKGLEHLVETIGKARNGDKESSALFDKYSISLSDAANASYSSQQVFDQVAKKILAIEDPAKRAATAVEMFGKKGEELIETLRNLEKEKGDGMILSERELATLEAANNKVESLTHKLKTLAAKGWAAAMTPFTEIDAMKAIVDRRENKGAAVIDQSAIQQAKEAAKALELVEKAKFEKQYATANLQEKYLKSLIEAGDLQREFNGLKDGTIEKLKVEKEMIDAQTKVIQARKAMEDDQQRKKKESDEAHVKKLKEEHDLNKDIAKTQREIDAIPRKREEMKRAPYLPTLEELANSSGPFKQQAQQLQFLEADAKDALIYNDKKGFKQDVTQIDQLKKSLSDAGVMTPDDRFESMDNNLGDLKDHMAELLEKAKTDGIKVNGGDE